MSTIDKHLTHATIKQAPEPQPVVDRTPVITEKTREDNLRRLKYPCFVTESYDANGNRLREYRDDPGISRDTLISSVSTDRGDGSRDSIKMLRDEGDVQIEGFLPRESEGPARDSSGRFASKDSQ